jgi:hypothetical protein
VTTERTLWYHRTWGLWAVGVSIALVTVLAGYVVQHIGGGAWGGVIAFFGVTVLSWAVPTAIARDARPPRPARAWPTRRSGGAAAPGERGGAGTTGSMSRAATHGTGGRRSR